MFLILCWLAVGAVCGFMVFQIDPIWDRRSEMIGLISIGAIVGFGTPIFLLILILTDNRISVIPKRYRKWFREKIK